MPLFVTSRRTTLGFEVLGPAPLQHARATSKVVFYIHGLAGNRFEYAVCDQLGPTGETTPPEACVISVDRPGHGDSSLWRGEDSIRGANGGSTSPYLSLAHDLLELADHLGVERYSLLAWSSGGPFALACSLVHPRSRLVKTMTVAGDPPWNKVPWRDINALQRLCWFIYSTRDVPGLAPALGRVVAGLFNGLGLMLGLAPEAVVPAVLSARVAETYKRDPSGSGLVADFLVERGDWGFEVAEIAARGRDEDIIILHGQNDAIVTPAAAALLKESLPRARLRIVEGEGHMVMHRTRTLVGELLREVGGGQRARL